VWGVGRGIGVSENSREKGFRDLLGSVADRVRAGRKAMKLGVEEAAELASLTPEDWRSIERGEDTYFSSLYDISWVLKLPLHSLLKEEGRVHGGRHYNTTLTEDDVRYIRSADDIPVKQLAEEFGLTRQSIRNIRAGVTWAHVK